MQENWFELIESLDGDIEALTLEQIKWIVELFESGLSGHFVASLIRGEFALEIEAASCNQAAQVERPFLIKRGVKPLA